MVGTYQTSRKIGAWCWAFLLSVATMFFVCNKARLVSAVRSTRTRDTCLWFLKSHVSPSVTPTLAFQANKVLNVNTFRSAQSSPNIRCPHSFASDSRSNDYISSMFHTDSKLFSNQNDVDLVSEKVGSNYDVILNDLNPAQAEAVTQPLQSITRVVAGPGAGKTRVLICRIAYLLKRDTEEVQDAVRNSRILAVTFTKKAASEMQHRLDTILCEDEKYQNQLALSQVPEASTNSDDEIYEEVVQSDNSVVKNGDSSSSMITRVTLGTFHSICAKILRWNGSELGKLPSIQHHTKGLDGDGLDGSFAIIDQSEQMRIIKQCISDAGLSLKSTGRGQADIRPITVVNAVGQLKSDDAMGADSRPDNDSNLASAGGIKMTSKVRRIAEDVYPLYCKALLSQNSVDFDDLILLTRELLKTNEEVRDRMSKRWQHILVDEFQDTSEVQLDLVKLLSRDSLLIVGDGDQSIYSWRGAHAESMADFVRKFEESEKKKVDTVYLMENYRSTTNIVRAAQKVISDDSPSSIAALTRQDMKPMRGKGPSPRVLACADAKAEANFVIREILKMEREGALSNTSTVALIYRTNAQSRALEEACVEHNLKYLIRGSAGTFYSRAEIKDCLCFLKWIYNGRDRSALIRAMKTPSRGLGDVSLNEFTTYCEEVVRHVAENDPGGPQPTPLDILLSLSKIGQGDDRSYLPPDGIITKRTMNKLLPFAMQMNKLCRKAQSQTVTELLGSIIDIMNLKNHFDAISKTSDEFADRWANTMELLNASERYTQDGACMAKKKVEINGEVQLEEMSPLGNFLDDVSLLTETEAADEGENGERRLLANLMTIHASKGMEFDVVCLVGNEESTFPTQRAIMEGEGSVELDEERRLCYVAMTRAKTHLIMTWRKEVTTFFGQGFKVSKSERSRFLDALMAKKVDGTSNNKTPKTRTSRPALDRHESKSDPRVRKVKKAQRPKVKSTRDSDPFAIPLPRKKKVVKRKKSSSISDTEQSRRINMQMLQKNADAREEREKWANYHAKQRAGQSGPSPKRARSVRGPSVSSNTSANVSEKGRRALSTKSSINPRGVQKKVRVPPSPRKKKVRVPPSPRTRASSVSPNANELGEKIRPESDARQIPEMDSTMFFPLGSGVNHVVHGVGEVIKPQPGQDTQNVHVKFDNGMQMDFPVGSAGLSIKY